jgi:hypothetical protein
MVEAKVAAIKNRKRLRNCFAVSGGMVEINKGIKNNGSFIRRSLNAKSKFFVQIKPIRCKA